MHTIIKSKKIIFLVNMTAIMLTIFVLSSQTVEESKHLSLHVGKLILRLLLMLFPNIGIHCISDAFIRKSAHVIIYCMLGFFSAKFFVK